MSIRSAKAQGIIGEIVLFAMTIFLAFALFFILSGSGTGQQSQSADVRIESSMESIRQRSALTSMLNGMVWRAPSVNDRYEDLSALKLTSYYFSSSGDIYIDGQTYDRDRVRNDLESYYRYRMSQNFINVPDPSDHALNITYNDQHIDVENINDRGGSWSSIEVPFQLSDGRVGQITMYVRGAGGVFQVE
jgi:hypothetical protein